MKSGGLYLNLGVGVDGGILILEKPNQVQLGQVEVFSVYRY